MTPSSSRACTPTSCRASTLWWGPWAAAVSEGIKEGMSTGMSADEIIDGLAEEWNELKAEYE